MATQINIDEAKIHLSRILDRVQQGEEFIFAKAGKPIAKLVPMNSLVQRKPGLLKGSLSDSVIDPLPNEELEAWE